MDSDVCDVFYSQRFHQHFSAVTVAIFRTTLLVQKFKCRNVVRYVALIPQ